MTDGFPGGMRAIWSGSIAFGLVNVPVKAYTAVREHDLRLHQVHDKDHGRIRYERHCEICGELVDFKHIQRAYDDGSTTVIITDEDLKELPAAARGEIDVVRFVPAEQIDLITLDGSYYLKPDSKAAKAYALLLHTLQETNRTAIVTFALRQKTRLGVLRVREGDLVLQSMTWPDEVRAVESPDLGSVELTTKEKDLASALVDHMTGDFDPDEFEDEYQVELRQLVEAKLEEGEAVDTAATFGESDSSEPEHGKVIDLMDALRRSIDRGAATTPAEEEAAADDEAAPDEGGAADEGDEEAAAGTTKKSGSQASGAKRASAQKSSAQKTASKKRTAKKADSKQSSAQKTAEKKSAPKKSAAKKSAAKKTTAKKPAAKKTQTRKGA